jgi:hypothetical protein
VRRLVRRFAVPEISKPPTSGPSVLCRVLNHDLHIHKGSGNKGLNAAKYLVVFIRGNAVPVQRNNDCSVRERKLSFAVSIDRYIVAQGGALLVEVTFLLGQ